MDKIRLAIVVFLLVTGPGAVEAWLSLIDRFRDNDPEGANRVTVDLTSVADIYQLFFPLFGLLILVIWLAVPRIVNRHGVEFYPDRDSLNKAERGLEDEAKRASEIWAAWFIGGAVMYSSGFLTGVITRLILLSPGSPQINEYVTMFPEITPEGLASDIKQVAQRTIDRGGAVRYADQVLINVTITNPNDKKAVARVETYLPHQEAHLRPSYIVYRHKNRELFDSIVESFSQLWESSTEVVPDQETSV